MMIMFIKFCWISSFVLRWFLWSMIKIVTSMATPIRLTSVYCETAIMISPLSDRALSKTLWAIEQCSFFYCPFLTYPHFLSVNSWQMRFSRARFARFCKSRRWVLMLAYLSTIYDYRDFLDSQKCFLDRTQLKRLSSKKFKTAFHKLWKLDVGLSHDLIFSLYSLFGRPALLPFWQMEGDL